MRSETSASLRQPGSKSGQAVQDLKVSQHFVDKLQGCLNSLRVNQSLYEKNNVFLLFAWIIYTMSLHINFSLDKHNVITY